MEDMVLCTDKVPEVKGNYALPEFSFLSCTHGHLVPQEQQLWLKLLAAVCKLPCTATDVGDFIHAAGVLSSRSTKVSYVRSWTPDIPTRITLSGVRSRFSCVAGALFGAAQCSFGIRIGVESGQCSHGCHSVTMGCTPFKAQGLHRLLKTEVFTRLLRYFF